MKKNLKMYAFCFSLAFAGALFFAVSANAALAASPLELIINNPIFNVSNALPGQSFSSPVTLLNHGDHHEIFQFEVDMKTNPQSLADHLFFKVTDGADNCLYGCTGNITLSYLDRREPDIARVDPHSTTYYKFILTFDPNAGNEFQSALTTFDMKLGFEGTVTTANGGGGGGGVAGPGGAAPGGLTGLTTGLLAGGAAGTGAVAGEETPGETQPGQIEGETTPQGQVEGAEVSACKSWPKWVWILALIIYSAAFLWRTFSNFSEQIEKRDIRWGWQAALAAAAFLFWYFFDFCREYLWFAIISLVGGAAVYLFYLYLFKRKLKVRPEKEIEEQAPPENPTDQVPPAV
jgi:hypothetical protein